MLFIEYGTSGRQLQVQALATRERKYQFCLVTHDSLYHLHC